MPHPWEVRSDGHDAFAGLAVERLGIGLTLLVMGLLQGTDLSQTRVPVGLQRVCNKAVVWIDLEESATGKICFIASPLELLAPQFIGLPNARGDLVLDLQGERQGGRCDLVQQLRTDRSVEAGPL
ncbi:MAG: hypothetical protein IPI02_05400 [Sterolibacteriaceae bacterium]|nr:hypothetical protein [Sterolibacteriaceae bacterium]